MEMEMFQNITPQISKEWATSIFLMILSEFWGLKDNEKPCSFFEVPGMAQSLMQSQLILSIF